MKFSFYFSLLLSLLTASTMAADAQSTVNAASCNQSDVQSALNSVSASTTVVNVPAGTCSWSSAIKYTVPSSVTNLTIKGQTSVTFSGTAGSSSYAHTVNDSTIIQDAYQNNNPALSIVDNNGGSAVVRVTGFTFEGGSIGSTNWAKWYGFVNFAGTAQARIDDNHFNVNTYSPAANTAWVLVTGPMPGVADHNVFELGTNNSVSRGVLTYYPYTGGNDYGDGAWTGASNFGSGTKFFFIESNYFTGGAPNDCNDASAFVMRYNNIDSAYVPIQTHGTKTPEGGWRGCRAMEAYNNYFTGSTSTPSSGIIGMKGGTALVYNNTVASGYYRFFASSTDRNNGAVPEVATPGGWGYCGSNSVNPSSGSANGSTSDWDGNSSSATGYPCIDGLGRGQTQQALNGQFWPNRLNSVTGTIAWPQQFLEPIYLWNNNIGTATYALVQDISTTANRDYYGDCGAGLNSGCTSTFNGTQGTGFGTAASRPSTCTAGPGGTYGTSPTGSYGVGYFSTDTQTLSVCTAQNTWTNIYTPYVYPYPLVSGTAAPVAPATPPAPSNLTGTVVD